MVGRHEKWRQQEERRKEGERRQEKRHDMPVPATPTGVVELGQGAGEAVRCIVRVPGGVKLGQGPARLGHRRHQEEAPPCTLCTGHGRWPPRIRGSHRGGAMATDRRSWTAT
jgi:hypothetical protein